MSKKSLFTLCVLRIVKKSLLLVGVLLTAGNEPAADAADKVEFVVRSYEATSGCKVSNITFVRNGETLFAPDWKVPQRRVGFMLPDLTRGYAGQNSRAFKMELIMADGIFSNWQDYLVDIKGDGDKRYLIVAGWYGGSEVISDDGYLIDTKNNFSVVGRIPTALCCSYPMPNPDLIFDFYDNIAYFDSEAGDVCVTVKCKLQDGREPVCVAKIAEEFSLKPYRDILADESLADRHEIAFAKLYCDLASAGWLKHLTEYAGQLGFSREYINQESNNYNKRLRAGRLFKYLYELNGKDALPDVWEVVWLRDSDPDFYCPQGVEFYKNGKKHLVLNEFEDPYAINFIQHTDEGFFEPVYINRAEEENFNYKDYLLDIKGNGDYRYLIVYNRHVGNSVFCEDGYLIDTKDDFAVIGRVPVNGEIVRYPLPNPDLTFYFADELAYFGAAGSAFVVVELKIEKGKEPVCVSTVQKDFSVKHLEEYREECLENFRDDQELDWRILSFLYSDLAECGLLKDFEKYADQLGYSKDDIESVFAYYNKRIRMSRLFKYFYELNGKEAFPDFWDVVIRHDDKEHRDSGVEIHKNGKKHYELAFQDLHSIYFMVPIDNDKHDGHQRFISKIAPENGFDWQDYLVDIKGNGDKRYLIIFNSPFIDGGDREDGYLIDTKDDFAVIGRIPIGECYDYPMPNPDLIFSFSDTMAYFSGRAEAWVSVKFKLNKGKDPQWVLFVAESFSLEPYRKMLAERNSHDTRQYTLAKLYCDLASAGHLKYAVKYARELGFTPEEIIDGGVYLKKIRKSKFYEQIYQQNGRRP